jgi:hypothetical protein
VTVIERRACTRSTCGGVDAPLGLESSLGSIDRGVHDEAEECEEKDTVDPGGLVGGSGIDAGSTRADVPITDAALGALGGKREGRKRGELLRSIGEGR